MTSSDLLTSFKEIQELLSSGYQEKLYLNIEKFDKYYIEEFCHLLFNIIDELNTDINKLKKENSDLSYNLNAIKQEVDSSRRKIRN